MPKLTRRTRDFVNHVLRNHSYSIVWLELEKLLLLYLERGFVNF